MRFHLFGAVQVISNGKPVEIGRRRERGLLALLLLDVGRPVSTDYLIDLLCADAPDGRKALQVHVSRLRKYLPDVRLESLATGYVIHADPDSVDVHRFSRLVAEARQRTDPAEQARLLRAALSLQRGPICADLTSDELRRQLHARFDEICLSALELRIEADLALGAHNNVVAELAELAARYPTRERLVAARMTALYRCGRTREALEVYQQTARALAEELGIDPSVELRDLHTAILQEAPELRAPRGTIPAQLPAGLRTFTGRHDELTELLTTRDSETVVISAIGGMAGVGKTALAVHAAHQLAADYPDGQLFVDLHGFTQDVAPADPASVLDRLLRALGVPGQQIPQAAEDRAALYRSKLAGKRVLLVLDNAATESQVRPLLPATAGCLALITSRRHLTGLEHARPISVDILGTTDAMTLFRRVAGIPDAPVLLVSTVVELCGRLPLAIQVAAARLRARPSWTLEHLAELLSDNQTRLAELNAGERSVAAALRLSYAYLESEPRRLFRLLTLHHGGDIDAEATAALAGHDEVRPLLDKLVDERLLIEHEPGRYRFHDLVRAYAAERVLAEETEADRDAAVRRLLEFYWSMADAAGALLVPQRYRRAVPPPRRGFASRREALGWSETERANLVAACRQAYQAGYLKLAWQLPLSLWDVFYLRKHYSDWITTNELGLAATRESADRLAEAWLVTSLAHGYWEVRRYQDALRASLRGRELWREFDNPWGEGIALHVIASACVGLRRFDEGIERYHEALMVHDVSDNRWGTGWTLTSLGSACRELGRLDEALEAAKRALAVWQEVGDQQGAGIALNNLGDIHRELGRYDKAIDSHRQALSVTRRIGNRWGEAWALESIGKALHDSGDPLAAREHWRAALQIFEELGDARAKKVRARLATQG